MFKNLTVNEAREYAEATYQKWAAFFTPFHSRECLIGALDGFYKGCGVLFAPQDGPFPIGSPEFDAYYLGETLALQHLDYLDANEDDSDN